MIPYKKRTSNSRKFKMFCFQNSIFKGGNKWKYFFVETLVKLVNQFAGANVGLLRCSNQQRIINIWFCE